MESQKTGMVTNQVNKKPLHIMKRSQFLKESVEEEITYAIVILGKSHSVYSEYLPKVYQIFTDFHAIILNELPDELLHLRNIQHAINFVGL